MKSDSSRLTRIEELLGEVIEEVTLYKTPSGNLYETKQEAISSIIAAACPHGDSPECKAHRASGKLCHDCQIGTFLRNVPSD
jgi:predicted nucleic acid binding AN1-type Zn finger protein